MSPTEDQVQAALRAHHQTTSDAGVRLLELLALAHAGAADEAEARAAAEALRTEPELAETVLTLSSIEARGLLTPRPQLGKKIVATALALAACLLLMLLIPRRAIDEEQLSPKGLTEELALAVERNGRRFTARENDLLLPGDRLGLFYSSREPGYLAILHRDRRGEVVALYPANGARSAGIEAGLHVAVPDGAIVEEGSGCEWFVAIFSSRPLSVAELVIDVERAKERSERCELSVDVEGARAVRIFPVLRSP